MSGTHFKPGDHNIIDDRSGYKIKRSAAQKEWTGSTVAKRSFEERHPQDFIRSIPDHQAVRDPNPESSDRFLGINEVIDLYETPRSTVTATATPGGGNTGDGSITGLTADLTADTSGNYTLTVLIATISAADAQDPGSPATFRLTDPDGPEVGTGKADTRFDGGGLSFTLNEDGSTNFAVSDSFTIAVTVS